MGASQAPRPTHVSNLAEFEDLARLLNGRIRKEKRIRDFDGKPFDRAFTVISSPPSGGCGSEGCSCSPGLWLTAFEGPKSVNVRFGENLWTDFDYQHWRALVVASGAEEAC